MTTPLLAAFLSRAESSPDVVAIASLVSGGAGADETVTWREWRDRALAFAASAVALGIAPGDRVGVLAGNHPVWPIAEYGSHLAGLVTVGMYPTSAPSQVADILRDADVRLVIADTATQLGTLRDAGTLLGTLPLVVSAAGAYTGDGVVGWDAWLDSGRASDRLREIAGGARFPDVASDAALIYTSGSTGEPKGARISHATLAASATSIRDTLGFHAADSTLSFLPYSHAGERIFGLHTRVFTGMSAGLVPDHQRVWDAARQWRPTVFGGLPRFFEKLYELLERERLAAGAGERARWDRALLLGRQRSRMRRRRAPVPERLEREWEETVPALRDRLQGELGGRVRLATSGGAALPPDVAEYLDAAGLTVLGAYGLTEHLCAAMHRPHDYDFDSVGIPLPGTEIRIAGDGEVLLRRCALTFSGYHGKPAETSETFSPDGEWLRTGDLGSLDARGRLRIEGRKKELIALSTGKKVAPLPIEARLAAHPWISQAVVYGEGRKFLTALIALRRPLVEAWAASEGIAGDFAELLGSPRLLEQVHATVEQVNARLSRTEGIKRFTLLERELCVETGELTPTLKVRRDVVAARYHDRLEELYRS